MLSHWIDALLLAVTAVSAAYALASARRERQLLARIAARERGGHLLGESPDLPMILRRAFAAFGEILPLSRFTLYRVGEAGRVEDVWTVSPPAPGEDPEPHQEVTSDHVGQWIDSGRLLELTVTETDRSFAPKDLLAGGPPPRRLRLPLYSGDRLVAHLVLESNEPVDDMRKAEIRALLGPLTSSLLALRNWAIAVTDELTGVSSRRYFETRLAEEWARRGRYGSSLAVACFDLDRFKSVNDRRGHAAGDLVLRRFGEIVREAIRSSDVAGRLGGEEFAVLFPEANAEAARAVADRIRRRLSSEPFEFERETFHITVSAGVSEASGSKDREQMMFQADKALYRAKESGRDRVLLWEEKKEGGS